MTIEQDALLSLTRELVEQPSENPPGNETAVVAVLEEHLKNSPIPFEIERYDVEPGRPNLIAHAGDPDRGTVLLTGHTDVVPANAEDWSDDPYRFRRVRDRIIGRGAADMKGALAAKLLAAESYLTDSSSGRVTLAFVCDEEHEGIGMRALVDRGVRADCAIVGEPTRLQICTAQKGVVRYRITVHGKSAHSGTPNHGINSIKGLNRIIQRLEEFDEECQQKTPHPLLTPETVTVTEIEGGIAPNVVPDSAQLTVDWRLLPGGSVDQIQLDTRIEDIVTGLAIDGQPLDVTVDRLVFARGAEIDRDHELVDTAIAAAADVGLESEPVGFNAATDARFLIHHGIPTVLFGPGSIEEDAHTVEESIRVDDLVSTAEMYRRFLERVLD